MSKRIRIISIITAFIFVSFAASLLTFNASSSGHDCVSDEKCAYCAELEKNDDELRRLENQTHQCEGGGCRVCERVSELEKIVTSRRTHFCVAPICEICRFLSSFNQLLKKAFLICALIAVAVLFAIVCKKISYSEGSAKFFATPISLKVKLTN